ncbi:hypothetical protein KTD13_01940 [Burkholderia multivorans]|uniref:hypothetical protein n=1 Tax=Burkholderia multivorans TaxID=87883 RepID=UPI001C229C0E|nr:hypothetical protein [Burkholderia multivorans]MBU9259108.1 hypothetical protein [Burkholderia multivorans]
MGFLGPIGDYVSSTFKEIGKHPLQAAGAALGVPGFDPAIGGTFNNHEGGALLSPTGNFTSSAWGEMYKDNPGAKSGLDMFHSVNKVADVVAPLMAGGYAMGSGIGTGSGTFGGGLLGGPASVTGAGANGGTASGGLLGSQPMFAMPKGTAGVSTGGLGSTGFMGSAGPQTGLFSGLSPTASADAMASAAPVPMGGITAPNGLDWQGLAKGGFNLMSQYGQQQAQQQPQQPPQPLQALGGDPGGSAALQAMSQRLSRLYGGGQ